MSVDGSTNENLRYREGETVLSHSNGVFITYLGDSIYYYTEKESVLLSPIMDAVQSTDSQVTISWQPVQGAEEYAVYAEYYRYTDGDYEYDKVQLAVTQKTTFTDSDSLENTWKRYYVVPIAEGKIGMPSRRVFSYNNYRLWYYNYIPIDPRIDINLSGNLMADAAGIVPFDLGEDAATVKINLHAILGPVEVQYAPWIWSTATGWAFEHLPENGVGGEFFFVGGLGWTWTDEGCFPFVYDFSGETWAWIAPWTGRPWYVFGEDGSITITANPSTLFLW